MQRAGDAQSLTIAGSSFAAIDIDTIDTAPSAR
jgi:hypothetical protein